jgi:hypothetical protein
LAFAFNLFDILDLTSALAVIIPGIILLSLLRGLKVPSLRNMTIILSSFAILHGFYHLSYLIGDLYIYAPEIDLVTAIMLVMLGMYYSNRVIAASLFLISLPETAGYLVPVTLALALVIFAWLAIRSKSISSLQAQLSIFIIIWIVAELLRSLLLLNVISATPSMQLLGLEIHTAAMLAFGFFMLFRYYRVTVRASASGTNIEWLTKSNESDGSKSSSEIAK